MVPASFGFNGFTLKTALPEPRYLRLAAEWTAADADHRETTKAEFWFEQGMNTESYILEDRYGVVFFFKMTRVKPGEIELHIQFPPVEATAERQADRRIRVITGLTKGLEWIERVLEMREAKTIFFDSRNPGLVHFCEKRLGFTSVKLPRPGRPGPSAQPAEYRLEKAIPARMGNRLGGRRG